MSFKMTSIVGGAQPPPTLRQRLEAFYGEQLTPRTIVAIESLLAEAIETGTVEDPAIRRGFEIIMPQVERAKALAMRDRTRYRETLWARFKVAKTAASRLALLDRINNP